MTFPEPTQLARELNRRLEVASPEVLAMLSPLGRRLYFPKGILSQSAEASEGAHRFNATIGIATVAGKPMHLPSVTRHLADLDPADAVDYAPAGGRSTLRERWREKQLGENPSQRGKRCGLPIATSAITHGLSLVGDLFVEAGDVIVIPDKLWGNYRLTYEVRLGATLRTFPFYAGSGFNREGFARTLAESAEGREKVIVLLNVPNNPTGYVPSTAEGEAISNALVRQAEGGTRILAVLDDAYFGFFYHLGGATMTESLFGILSNRHPNLLAVKLDGATKEFCAWGLRCGFLTFGPGRRETADEVATVLDTKVRGAIRSGISNVSRLSQLLVERALASSSIDEERKAQLETLRARAEKAHEVAHAPRFRESWRVYPFNSGYFMSLQVEGLEAEAVRLYLLGEYGIGVIATGASDLRIAFSCLELDEIEPLFEALHRAIQELLSRGGRVPG